MSFESGSDEVLNRKQSVKSEAGPDVEFAETLRNYRLSICTYSEAAMSRTQSVQAAHGPLWRLALAWGLGFVLVVGGVSGGVTTHQHRQQMAQIAAVQQAERERVATEERARLEEEDLLAKVDSDVSREVPSAMEPLAQMMSGDSIQ